MNRFEWVNARNPGDAAASRSTLVADAMRSRTGQPAGDATVFKAGGVDLLDLMKERLLTPQRVVNLNGMQGLAGIATDAGGGLRIGALCTLAQVADHPLVRTRHPALAQAAAEAASPQIRQVATLGGNLLQRPRCWYFRSLQHHCARKGGATCFAFGGENDYHAIFDHAGCAIVHPSTPATALVAFNARVELEGAAGRRTVALEAFFLTPAQSITRENDLRPGEILTAVLLAPPGVRTRSAHLRQGQLDSFDWPLADVAVVLEMSADDTCRMASVVLGAAAPVPHRARAAQQALIGKRIDEDAARAAAHAALAGAQPLSGNAYKLPIFEALVRRAVLTARNEGRT